MSTGLIRPCYFIPSYHDAVVQVELIGDAVEDVGEVEDGEDEEEPVGPHAQEGDCDEARSGPVQGLCRCMMRWYGRERRDA